RAKSGFDEVREALGRLDSLAERKGIADDGDAIARRIFRAGLTVSISEAVSRDLRLMRLCEVVAGVAARLDMPKPETQRIFGRDEHRGEHDGGQQQPKDDA